MMTETEVTQCILCYLCFLLYISDRVSITLPLFLKKFIQVCEEKKYEHSSANPLRTGTERFYELL